VSDPIEDLVCGNEPTTAFVGHVSDSLPSFEGDFQDYRFKAHQCRLVNATLCEVSQPQSRGTLQSHCKFERLYCYMLHGNRLDYTIYVLVSG